MKRSIFLILVLLISLFGCSDKQDTLKFNILNTAIHNKKYISYEMNIGNTVSKAVITSELWQNGECVKSDPLEADSIVKEIDISFLIDMNNSDGTKGLSIQIDTDDAIAADINYFELPKQANGYSFTAYKDGEVIEITADKDIILAALAFDTGDGVRTADCKAFTDEPEKLSEYSCISVIRMSFEK